VSLVDLEATPIGARHADGIETTAGEQPFDIIIWATGFDFGTGALTRHGHPRSRRARARRRLGDGPKTYMGVQVCGFPNLFIPRGRTRRPATTPLQQRSGGLHRRLLVRVREQGLDTIEVDPEAETTWDAMIDKYATITLFGGGPREPVLRRQHPREAAAAILLNSAAASICSR
jgi:cation diffusion facilitator CzcD-associated flavoprotein CzcO